MVFKYVWPCLLLALLSLGCAAHGEPSKRQPQVDQTQPAQPVQAPIDREQQLRELAGWLAFTEKEQLARRSYQFELKAIAGDKLNTVTIGANDKLNTLWMAEREPVLFGLYRAYENDRTEAFRHANFPLTAEEQRVYVVVEAAGVTYRLSRNAEGHIWFKDKGGQTADETEVLPAAPPAPAVHGTSLRIGMSSSSVLAALGAPADVTKSTFSWGTAETWYYASSGKTDGKRMILHFRGDTLDSWTEN